MNNPKFAIGEEVLVLSERVSPGNWVERTIAKIVYPGNHIISGVICEEWSYQFECGSGSPQSNVRKKHRPADQSFSELISSLDGKVVA